MRNYPRNSPRAAGRIVALALLADGHLSPAELDTLDRHGVARRIGLTREELHRVLHDFCADLLATAELSWSDACRIDGPLLAALYAEVDDPALRRELVELIAGIAVADGHLAEGESVVLRAAEEHWGLRPVAERASEVGLV